jgi:carboxyl-terminal processing protease
MMQLFAQRTKHLLLVLICGVSLTVCRADVPAQNTLSTPVKAAVSAPAPASEKQTNAWQPVTPGPIDGRIAWVTAALLQQGHYIQQPFNTSISSKFFDRYFDTLDPQHIHFLQGDIAEFERYRTNLDRMTLPARNTVADTRPACEIFNRFMLRMQQHVAYVDDLLKHEKFGFDTDERVLVNRHESPYPKDLAEARQIWRERLFAEYLQEKLGKDAAKKKAAQSGASNSVPAINLTETNRTSTGNILTNAGLTVVAPAQLSAKAETPATTTGTTAADKQAQAKAKSKSKSKSKADAAEQARLQQQAEAKSKAATELERLALEAKAKADAEAQAKAVATAPAPAAVVATNTTTATTAAPAHPKKTDAEEIVDTLTRRYTRTLHYYSEWGNDEVLERYLTTLAHVYDPHSDYMGHAQLDSFSISMNLALFGIGAELQATEDGFCTIRRLLAGGPAEKSKKIKVNDRIVAVAQGDQAAVDIVDMSLPKAVQLIRGPKGSEVRLTVIPANADTSTRNVVTLIRDEIPLEDQAAKARIIELSDASGAPLRVGVIDLPSFYAPFDVGANKRNEPAAKNDSGSTKSTTGDVVRLINKLKQEQVKGVILDLRRNGGGSLEEAIRLTGIFIKDGPVVQVRNSRDHVDEDPDTDPSIVYDGPLMLLTSRFSASASEIVAGALQDYGRALIVGDSSTHGKGTVQMVNMLRPAMQLPEELLTNDPGALKLTIKKFYRPSGASTQLKGVVPDIVLPNIWNESKEIGESALENPLVWDTIRSAKYDPVNMVAPYTASLKARSNQRIATNTEFGYIREDIDIFKKQQADKTVSLNEATRIKEKNEAEARAKARDKERLARPQPAEKVYELTLAQALKPGLPAPVAVTNTAKASLSKDKGKDAEAVAQAAQMAESGKAIPADEDEEEKPAAVDPTLSEAEHIMADYVTALSHPGVASVNKAP